MEGAIRNAGAKGRKITLSGGEPLLHPRITDFVRLAKSVSTLPVLLQTNAIRLANSNLAQTLAEAGLDEAFVSLHGATAEVSDVVTHAPGTFEKTVLGLDALLEAGIRTQINFVICQANLHQLSAWVTLLADRWPTAFANISFVAPSTDVVPREHALVSRRPRDVGDLGIEEAAFSEDIDGGTQDGGTLVTAGEIGGADGADGNH